MGTYPVNQVFLGSDPYSESNMDIDTRIKALKAYEEQLKNFKNKSIDNPNKPTLWNSIDAEISPMNEEQRSVLASNEDYIRINSQLQSMVQSELLKLVKDKIEDSEEGNKLLKEQLELVRKLKVNIVEESNREMELFKKFREFSKTNPNVTYEEFIKNSK